jgi:hypothetical protein
MSKVDIVSGNVGGGGKEIIKLKFIYWKGRGCFLI